MKPIKSLGFRLFNGLFGMMFCFIVLCPVQAQNTAAPKATDQKMSITTDQAIVDTKAKYTEFIGHVTLTFDETRISGDWIKVTYTEDISKIKGSAVDESVIDTITAKGNVRIHVNDMVAMTTEAIYTSVDDTFVLTGENTSITSGNNKITSDKVTINRTDQTFKAESLGKTPVNAVFYNEPKVP